MLKTFSGAGGPATPTNTDDNLFSTDIVEVVLGVSEGPIEGLADGPKSFLIGDTPMRNNNGDDNFDSFELVMRKGSELGETIVPRMGGFSSSTGVNTELGSGVPVTRQASHFNIDYVDIRLVVNRLLKQNDKGNFNHTGKVRIEYKKTNATQWNLVQTAGYNPLPVTSESGSTSIFRKVKSSARVSPTPGDRQVYRQADAPPVAVGEEGALWFDSNDNNKPYRQNGSSWAAIGGASFSGGIWSWPESSAWKSNQTTRLFVSGGPITGQTQGDFWLNTNTNQIMLWNGSSWIFAGTSLQPGNFGNSSIGVNAGEVSIRGKTSTATVIEFRFPIDNISDDTYQFRLTKTSPNNTSEEFFDVTWESFQEITTKPMTFPGLATVQATARASEQFSSIPQFSGIYKGRTVKVPSNYDPVARTFAGMWDGTWKIAYSNNPAFIVNDLVENDRYGLNSYYPVVLSKWDVYEAGVWCDTRTAEGHPRFTFNLLLDTPRNCREAIDFICGIFGGRFFDDGNGSANIRIDRSTTAAGIFTKENVLEGVFTYSFTDTTTRYNDITVTFKNPDLQYKEDRVRVFDQDHINKYSRIPLNFIAVGCNSRREAVTRGRYKLATGIGETAIVNFKTNRMGLYYVPYDIILISDEDMNGGLSGRVKEVTGPKTITLRDPISLEAGANYKLIFQVPDGTASNNFLLLERDLPAGLNGIFSTLTTVQNLPAGLPENAVFSVSTSDDKAAPLPFRITRIDEIEGDPDKVEIQAIEVNRQKWPYVDGLTNEIEPPLVYDLETGGRPNPVPAVRLRPFNTFVGGDKVYNLLIDWDPSPTKTVSRYRILMSRDDGPTSILAETHSLSYEFNSVPPGEYLFSIIAISPVSGAMSDSVPTSIEHRFIGDIKDPTRVTDLHLVDELLPFEYARRSPTFAWSAITEPTHRDYVIRISDAQSGLLMAQYFTRDTQFTYAYDNNRTDHGGTAVRAFTIGAASRDQYGNVSTFYNITVNNPPPPAVAPLAVGGINSAVLQWITTGIIDYAGAKLWISPDPAVPMNGLTLYYEGGGNNYTFIGLPGTVYYARLAVFDNFNPTDYLVSNPLMFTTETIDLSQFEDIFDGPIGYITDDGGAGLAANLRSLDERLTENSIIIARQGIADWAQRDSLKRTVERTNTRFSEEINVLENADISISNRITEFEAAMDTETTDTRALITLEETARATQDEALGVRITNVIATATTDRDTITSRIQTEEQARSTAVEGLATTVSSVSTVANNAAAAVVTERTARISADSANATATQEVATNLNNYHASGRAVFQVASTPGGANSRYSVVVRAGSNGNWYESGLFLDVMDNGQTRAGIKANSFFLLNDQAGYLTSPFYVAGGVTYINNALIVGLTADRISVSSLQALSANLGDVSIHGTLIVNGSIYTDKVGNQEMSRLYGTVIAGGTNHGQSASFTSVVDLYVDSRGSGVVVNAFWHAESSGSGTSRNICRLLRDGNQVADCTFACDDVPTTYYGLHYVSDNAGPSTYTLQVRNESGASGVRLRNKTIQVHNGRR